MEYLHNLGIMHLDLNPNNIVMIKERPKLIDFGISKLQTSTKKTRLLGYSPRYAAYETVLESTCSFKSDIWSLACIIFYIFTNKEPY